jgi:hypothetical protein
VTQHRAVNVVARTKRSRDSAPEALLAVTAEHYGWAMLLGVWLVYFCFGLTTASLVPLVGPIRADSITA